MHERQMKSTMVNEISQRQSEKQQKSTKLTKRDKQKFLVYHWLRGSPRESLSSLRLNFNFLCRQGNETDFKANLRQSFYVRKS